LIWKDGIRGGTLEILSKSVLQEIHYSTLEVLQEVGVVIHSDNALKVLTDVGTEINHKKKLVRFPPSLVEEAIRKTPSTFTLWGRNPKKTCKLEPKRVHFAHSGLPSHVLDLNGNRRQATYKDEEDLIKLTDALEWIHIANSGVSGVMEEMGAPEAIESARRFLLRLQNTDKPGGCDVHRFGVFDMIKLCSIVQGDFETLKRRPMGWVWVNTLSPLQHTPELTENALVYAKHGLPILLAPAVASGLTGPATLAGTLVQQNAEILSGVALLQMAVEESSHGRPPLIMGCASDIFDMSYANVALGSAEAALLNVATAQLARFYQIPSRGSGGATDAIIPDAQAGYETGMGVLMSALAGINIIIDAAGGLEPGIGAVSYEKYVMDNDALGSVARICEGIQVSTETMAVNLMEEIKPGGEFLTHESTRTYFRKEQFYPTIFSRWTYPQWKREGNKDLRQRANAQARKILEIHEPEPLDKEIEKEVTQIVKKIENRERKG